MNNKTIRLTDLIPQPFYNDVYEMALLMKVQQYQLDDLQEAINQAQDNFFPIVANEEGLAIFEKMLGITGVVGLDIETRRYNVIARMLPPRPITLKS
ncbi:putative phage tail protein, partial [Lactococcus petauri]